MLDIQTGFGCVVLGEDNLEFFKHVQSTFILLSAELEQKRHWSSQSPHGSAIADHELPLALVSWMPTCVRLTYHSTRLSYSQVRHRFIQRQGHQLTLTSIALVLKTLVIESLPPHSEKFMGGVFKQMEMDLIVEVIQCLWSKQEANESRRQHSKVILVLVRCGKVWYLTPLGQIPYCTGIFSPRISKIPY